MAKNPKHYYVIVDGNSEVVEANENKNQIIEKYNLLSYHRNLMCEKGHPYVTYEIIRYSPDKVMKWFKNKT
jgi:hypothetical protein